MCIISARALTLADCSLAATIIPLVVVCFISFTRVIDQEFQDTVIFTAFFINFVFLVEYETDIRIVHVVVVLLFSAIVVWYSLKTVTDTRLRYLCEKRLLKQQNISPTGHMVEQPYRHQESTHKREKTIFEDLFSGTQKIVNVMKPRTQVAARYATIKHAFRNVNWKKFFAGLFVSALGVVFYVVLQYKWGEAGHAILHSLWHVATAEGIYLIADSYAMPVKLHNIIGQSHVPNHDKYGNEGGDITGETCSYIYHRGDRSV